MGCTYLGGHPSISSSTSGGLEIYKSEINFSSFIGALKDYNFQSFRIPIKEILNAEFKDETEISKDVTLARLLTLGVLAFAAKKKKKKKNL